MKNFLRAILFVAMLFVAMLFVVSRSAQAQVSVGIVIGAPPPPRAIVRPAIPYEGAVWVEGYWYPVGHHYKWHNGYWTRPPYEGARWVAPRHDGERYYNGYWEGDRGRVEHDHHWDRQHDRDYHDHDKHGDRDHDRDHDHDHDR
jgi:hypothetical protein